MQDCASTFGADPTTWKWGDLHQVRFEHALANLEGVALPLNVGLFPVGGSSSTTMVATYRTDNLRITNALLCQLSYLGENLMILAKNE